MSNEKGHYGLLYIFDCIAVVAGSIIALGISKFVFRAEVRTDLMVILLFMVAIRLLVMALGDLTGFSQKIWKTVLLVFIAEVCVVAVEYVMVFGLSQRLMTMTAGIDLVLVLIAHAVWSRRRQSVPVPEQETVSEESTKAAGQTEADEEAPKDDQGDKKDKKVSWLLRGSVLDDTGELPEEAADAEEEIADEDSGTAQDWLEDEEEDFAEDDQEPETAGLFTREDDAEESGGNTAEDLYEAEPESDSEAEAVPAAESEAPEAPQDEAEEDEIEPEPEMQAEQQAAAEVEPAAEQDAAQDVEVALNHFIDILSSDAGDQAYRDAADHLKTSLTAFSKYRSEEPFASTSQILVNQLSQIESQQDVTAEMIDNVIKIAQQVESIEQVEKVVEAPNATAEKPIEARRVKKSDYHIQDGEVLLDSGDSEIIISREDLELIRSYMKEHRQDK
ncbi:hypothetical protein [Pseudoramibacter sp.]|jgi:hypothetical protein|uniref:hypothetical protein n=1 Tax=Pseudoramibacter sp. TaxID=2034862 RepID=UPI0025E50C6B|nr:hypothetical protein [Pseudoramibacter sp.]MCH4072520.1 hypothetical protein [Pseudoramibacter sp.]MCH4106291.1 hypothetical protein [Pseudoramibacter sp.]